MTETENGYERFAKWQGVTREQLGATSNLVLGLATGLLAFTTLLLLDKKLVASFAFGFGIAACFLLAMSVVLALWCATNRLTDFRLTTKIANPKNSSNPQLEEWREESKCLGERTWTIFRGQLWSFALGSGVTGVGIFIQLFSGYCARAL
jgi:Na+/melibiose symporter-like transporter